MTISKKNITPLEIILLTVVFLFAVFVIRAAAYNLVDKQIIGKDLMFLTILTWVIILVFQFKALRNESIFLLWLSVSLILSGMYFWLFNDKNLVYIDTNGETHNYSHGLISPFLILIFFQICRQLSLKYYKFELGLPSRVFKYIVEEKRNETWLDICFVIGYFLIPFITFYF